jgi:putative FmdB family regulatory protein
MASYDLRCSSCGKEFDVFVLGFLKDEAKVCPDCGSRQVEQRFTGFQGFVGGLSGSGVARADGGAREPHRCAPSSGFG